MAFSSTPVGYQAVQATGIEDMKNLYKDVFKNKPQHSRLNLLSKVPRCNSMSGATSSKRKVDDTSFIDNDDPYKKKESPEAFTLMEAISMNASLGKQLELAIKETPNTVKKIKELYEKIKKNNSLFERKMIVQWIEAHRFEKIDKILIETESQTEQKNVTAKDTCDQATQTDDTIYPKNTTLTNIPEITNIKDFTYYATLRWEENTYKNSKIIIGNPLTSGCYSPKVVFIEPNDKDMSLSIQKLFRDKYPELIEAPGEFEVLEQTTKIGNTTYHKRILKVQIDGTHEDLWDKLNQVKKLNLQENKIILHHIENISNDVLRKMTQAIFNDTEIEVDIYTTNSRLKNTINKERPTYGMIVSGEGNSYLDLLTKVKQAIKNKNDTDAIRTIRSTKEGKLLLTLDKNDEALRNIKDNLRNQNAGLLTTELGPKKNYTSLLIRGITMDSAKEDVENAITQFVDTSQADYRISDLRPMGNQRLTATITLRDTEAEKLVAERNIQIGLVRCKIIKKIKVPRCSVCWSYNHTRDKCAGPHRQCHKCGGTDHQTDNCVKDEDMCPLCELPGHRAGTSRCASFKTALKKVKTDKRTTSRQTSTASVLDNNTYKVATNILDEVISQSITLGKPKTGPDIDASTSADIVNTINVFTNGD